MSSKLEEILLCLLTQNCWKKPAIIFNCKWVMASFFSANGVGSTPPPTQISKLGKGGAPSPAVPGNLRERRLSSSRFNVRCVCGYTRYRLLHLYYLSAKVLNQAYIPGIFRIILHFLINSRNSRKKLQDFLQKLEKFCKETWE